MLIITPEMRTMSDAWKARQAELVPDLNDPRTPVEILLAGLMTEREFWSLVISNDPRAATIRRHLRARFREVSDHDVATVLATLGPDTPAEPVRRCAWCSHWLPASSTERINVGPSVACIDVVACSARQDATMTEAHA